jgi:hypothetical protein
MAWLPATYMVTDLPGDSDISEIMNQSHNDGNVCFGKRSDVFQAGLKLAVYQGKP